MGAREELAAVLVCEWCGAAAGKPCREWDTPVDRLHEGGHHTSGRLAAADALLASPALARLLDEARREAWDEGWGAAAEVVEIDGVKAWAHTVMPEGYEGNPYSVGGEGHA